jgi:hypothetical protein
MMNTGDEPPLTLMNVWDELKFTSSFVPSLHFRLWSHEAERSILTFPHIKMGVFGRLGGSTIG